jgi:RNA-directed DNA polymerase
MERRAEREGALNHHVDGKSIASDSIFAERATVGDGEAVSGAVSNEACPTRHDTESAGPGLLAQVLARENMQRAWKRVKANKGAAGVDGMDIATTGRYLVTALPNIRVQLMEGTYRPSPVRRVGIPKPDGSERELGIPTVVGRCRSGEIL